MRQEQAADKQDAEAVVDRKIAAVAEAVGTHIAVERVADIQFAGRIEVENNFAGAVDMFVRAVEQVS